MVSRSYLLLPSIARSMRRQRRRDDTPCDPLVALRDDAVEPEQKSKHHPYSPTHSVREPTREPLQAMPIRAYFAAIAPKILTPTSGSTIAAVATCTACAPAARYRFTSAAVAGGEDLMTIAGQVDSYQSGGVRIILDDQYLPCHLRSPVPNTSASDNCNRKL